MNTSVGTHPNYGNSFAYNFASYLSPTSDKIPILCIGALDIRHLLRTIFLENNESPTANSILQFCFLEDNVEVLARILFFLSVILDQETNLMDRVKWFLEIHSNVFISKLADDYLVKQSKRLILLITGEKDEQLSKYISLSDLKSKERDLLEEVLQRWIKKPVCDMSLYWDTRLRGYYKDRYDVRRNLMDWDYVSPTGIKSEEFMQWREKGIAYTFQERGDYSTPNYTMLSYTEAKTKTQQTIQLIGYWGDIVNSPFSCYALKSMQQCDDITKKTAHQIAEENITLLFQSVMSNNFRPFIASLILNNSLESLSTRVKFSNYFDAIYVSNTQAQNIKPVLHKLSKEKATLFVENATCMLLLTEDQKKLYIEKIDELAETAGSWKPTQSHNKQSDMLIYQRL